MATHTAAPAQDQVREWLAAAGRGDLAAMKRHAEIEPALIDAQGKGPYWTGRFRAIHYAAYRGDRRMLRWLLARGASAVPLPNDADWAPIHFAAVPPKPEIVRLLRAHGAEPDIFTASSLGDARAVRRMLADDPSLIGREGPDGGTPLHFATSAGVARVLMDAGADPQRPDRFHKQTPVHWARERPDVLAVLLGDEAKRDIHVAAALGDLRTVKALMREDGDLLQARITKARPIVGAKSDTPLAVAVRYGQTRVVDWLIEQGADAAVAPSLLPAAVKTGQRALVASLLAAGADPNAFDAEGHAPLHLAAAAGNVAMLRQLLAAKAKIHLKDKEHDSTPLAWAVYHQKPRAVEYLRRQGAV